MLLSGFRCLILPLLLLSHYYCLRCQAAADATLMSRHFSPLLMPLFRYAAISHFADVFATIFAFIIFVISYDFPSFSTPRARRPLSATATLHAARHIDAARFVAAPTRRAMARRAHDVDARRCFATRREAARLRHAAPRHDAKRLMRSMPPRAMPPCHCCC
jgi:hypothetical protein